jgi:predicted dehydrogenase
VLKTAIVGCGKIADEHAQQISRIAGCELAGLCDSEILMAKQMHERFNRAPYFDDLGELLHRVKPHVVHITTPPQSHFALADRCLAAGCHVYVEKPFTLNALEAECLMRKATERGLKMTVGHHLMFTDVAVRMRALIAEGFLGGSPIHAESYYCYDLADPAYAKAFLGDKDHWVRTLPGGLLQNIISHGISRIVEHLKSDSPSVLARGYTSQALKDIGEQEIIDELRVIIEGDGTTAYFTFSSQMRPQLSQLRLYGVRNGLVVDDNQHVLIKLNGAKRKSYLENFVSPASFASQYAAAATSNVFNFITWRLHMSAGMKTLIERFYRSIVQGEPLPIPYREILLTTRVMDAIFEQVNVGRRHDLVVDAAQTLGGAS